MVFTCENCKKSFSRKDNLNRHIKLHSCSKQSSKTYTCPLCPTTFSRKNELKRHVIKSDKHQAPFHCPKCQVRWMNGESFINHYIRHSRPKNFKCRTCDKVFYCNDNRSKHESWCNQMTGGSSISTIDIGVTPATNSISTIQTHGFKQKSTSDNVQVYEARPEDTSGIWSSDTLKNLIMKDLKELISGRGALKYQVALETTYQNALKPEVITDKPVIFKSEMTITLGIKTLCAIYCVKFFNFF